MLQKEMKAVQHTVFTPTLQVHSTGNGTAENLKTGTTTLAIICKDCVVMAADKRATAGNMIVDKKVEKVRPVTKHIVVTTAGSVSDIQLLYKYLSAELKVKHLRAGKEATVKEAANLLSGWVYSLLRSSYGIAHFLVGGYDDKPQLFDVYPDGSVTELDDYVASGSGSVFALGVLESQYKKNMTMDEGVQLALKAINTALARDSASGNGIDVYVIDRNGQRKTVTRSVSTNTEN
jgi:proteasome beta subunit